MDIRDRAMSFRSEFDIFEMKYPRPVVAVTLKGRMTLLVEGWQLRGHRQSK